MPKHPRTPAYVAAMRLDLLTQFVYDEATGQLISRRHSGRRAKGVPVGAPAAAPAKCWVVNWRDTTWTRAVLAVLYMRGAFPVGNVRHHDWNPLNDAFSNLIYKLEDGAVYRGWELLFTGSPEVDE